MKRVVLAMLLLFCLLGYSQAALAQEEVRVRPVDVYISGFGGYSFPFKTDLEIAGLEIRDAKPDRSPTFGGKIGVWFNGPRKTLGLDIGTEIDVTNFDPDIASGQILTTNVGLLISTNSLNMNATYFGVNVLARVPIGVEPNLPNGRWFPYIGVGGGGHRLTFQAPGTTEGRNTAPAFQGLGGVKLFVTKHIAVFAEGKFIHASNTIDIEGGGTIKLDLNSVHGTGGLSVHF